MPAISEGALAPGAPFGVAGTLLAGPSLCGVDDSTIDEGGAAFAPIGRLASPAAPPAARRALCSCGG